MADPEIDLLSIEKGAITAPAGCGKTQLIASALSRHTGPKPILVLTHTNAGVAALRGRLDRAGVATSKYRLSTLDGFAMRLIAMFPKRSGHAPAILNLTHPATDYPTIRAAAVNLLNEEHLDEILSATYDRLFVDEYQDCSQIQHKMTAFLADPLRCCVLGDPMQAIFGFKGNALVDWDTDVLACFGDAGELKTPWRWINAGEKAFGQWLLDIRKALLAGGGVDLTSAPKNVIHIALDGSEDHALRLKACLTKAPTADGSVLIIADSTKPTEQRRYARQTPGAVAAESVDLRDLVDFARGFDLNASNALFRLVQFASQVMVNVGPDDLLTRVQNLQSGKARKAPTETEQAALAFAAKPSYAGASALLTAINKEAGVRAHRPPVLRGCHKMFQLCESSAAPSIFDAAVQVREESRLIGRPLAKRTVGSTLLLKGLEADVAVILNPEIMNRNHLYVAMTRGSRTLVVCSDTDVLDP
ncbi:DNA helicase-2/ATP-dependent DNA helicase PcrA [Bradyrhizobium sp. cir1]|uniref:UvrD-helicase domain-containing protein n=1 Tax=Bradyrhizobium sp. cir1 TaxID=1445730 RepID=UPI0016058098|nr:UvrD-helicase domain-containing protein [Bradyrhizobium sp. cir1]MBB4373550.1 DNA helicase-2/ATP-dependent DNA helicase PcrA [Bradyrhizobium sp. cir1]